VVSARLAVGRRREADPARPGQSARDALDPASIGYSASHGCIRMYIHDAEWLFGHVHVGTQVFIVGA
jgi:hypothetical protein